jgi:hypothetical protein
MQQGLKLAVQAAVVETTPLEQTELQIKDWLVETQTPFHSMVQAVVVQAALEQMQAQLHLDLEAGTEVLVSLL